MIPVFDRAQINRQRIRSVETLASHDFLFNWSMDQLADRLSIVRRKFPVCVQIGARGPSLPPQDFGIETQIITDSVKSPKTTVMCEEDFFPFAQKSIDLIISALNLHTINDLPGALLQINRSLKPDGFFMAAMLGGETLYELRTCLAEAEIELSGGMTPRIAPFVDKPQMGALLQRAGFSLPVVDSDIVTVTYDSIFPLMHDLRLMGEGNAIAERSKHFTRKSLFLRAAELYAEKFSEADGRIKASFEIIFLAGWSPHESQQKPMRPGTAQTRLADYLGTHEIGTGETPH